MAKQDPYSPFDAQAEPADSGPTESVDSLREENLQLQVEARTAGDRALRAEAELDNARKRMRRDFEEQLRYATLPLVKDVLGVLDNLQRALDAAQSSDQNAGLKQGVQMVAGQLQAVLAQHHCRVLEVSPGAPFDPHRHEALGQEPNEAVPAGSISRVVREGYQMHDRVVRATQVLLSAGKPN